MKEYKPLPDSIADKVIKHLAAKPDLKMTAESIGQQFGVNAAQVHSHLSMAVESGLLKRAKGQSGEYCYHTAKAERPGVPEIPVFTNTSPAKALTRTVKLPLLGDVKIETGIPYPANAAPLIDEMTELLKMLEPGQSAELDIKRRDRLAVAVTRLHKAGRTRFKIITDKAKGKLRVWRVADLLKGQS